MSCGLTKDATASHGPSRRAAASSPKSSTTCSAKTPSRTVAAIGLGRAVRLAADPAGEAVGIEAVGPL
jgi:hypothetical protein